MKETAVLGTVIGGGAYVAGLDELTSMWHGIAADEAGLRPMRRSSSAPLRPPGALPEQDFSATCIRCMRCIDACPNHCLEPLPMSAGRAHAGTPTMHPRRAACMLCSHEEGDYLKCTQACPSGALRLVKKEFEDIQANVAIGTAVIDFNLCYSYNDWSCGACYRACPLAGTAMTVGAWERPTVHADACVGCGCCERACIRYPHAIRVKARSA